MPQNATARRLSVLAGVQVRMARAALRISAAELARGSGVSERTVWRIEQVSGTPMNATVESLERIRTFLESRGVVFLPAELGHPSTGPGIRIRQ